MLKIVYPICCGMDVQKSLVVACIASTGGHGVTTYKSHFSTFTKGLHELPHWLLQNDCRDICMESIGKYWIPIYNILEPTCKIVLAHPKYVKSIRGKKTDKKDAKWIADIFKHDLVSGSFIPPADIRLLQVKSIRKCGIVTLYSKKPSLLSPECCWCHLQYPEEKRASRTIQSSTTSPTGHLYIVKSQWMKPFISCNVRDTLFLLHHLRLLSQSF